MEETLGKRIVACRKRLGLTQDQLAEQLGVTAQAVSKWENDQSCPDIAMLPKLAEIFGTTTDALLGLAPKEPVFEAEVVPGGPDMEENENDGIHLQKGNWEFRWDSGRRSAVGMAVWVLLVGGLLLAASLLQWSVGFWDILWPSGLLVFGIFGLFPRFSFFRLGCGLLGGYFLLYNLNIWPFGLGSELLLPVFILLFGISLLVDALRKPKKPSISVTHKGRGGKTSSSCDLKEEAFDCNLSFGEETFPVQLPRLSGGFAAVSFGEMTVDLTGCGEIAENCVIGGDCSFGELQFLVPRWCRVDIASSKAFANISIKGSPDPEPRAAITLDASVSFGEITVRYI
ncbi:MAG: helix-turn-helix transcriptional regulator [Oscillospiraceae bacterium]|nr:helix-turn-helix transcriptional regulator [Oscillospiraceae bacterium]